MDVDERFCEGPTGDCGIGFGGQEGVSNRVVVVWNARLVEPIQLVWSCRIVRAHDRGLGAHGYLRADANVLNIFDRIILHSSRKTVWASTRAISPLIFRYCGVGKHDKVRRSLDIAFRQLLTAWAEYEMRHSMHRQV